MWHTEEVALFLNRLCSGLLKLLLAFHVRDLCERVVRPKEEQKGGLLFRSIVCRDACIVRKIVRLRSRNWTDKTITYQFRSNRFLRKQTHLVKGGAASVAWWLILCLNFSELDLATYNANVLFSFGQFITFVVTVVTVMGMIKHRVWSSSLQFGSVPPG